MQRELVLKARFLKGQEPSVYAVVATEVFPRPDCSILSPQQLLI